VRSGDLDRRVGILALTTTQDTAGQEVESYSQIAEVWAEVVDLRGGEAFAAASVNSQMVTRFRLRWRTDITTEHRLRFDGRDYDIIQKPIEIGRKAGLEIMARARTD
jgi:SPP1 family predicted phage head-tail adaptor